MKTTALPPLLPGKPFVQQYKDFRHVELDVFQVQVFLIVLLHLEQVVELEVQLKKPAVAAFVVQRNDKGAGERAGEVEVDIRSSVLGDVALLDDTLLFQLLMCELVRSQHLVLLLLSCLAFGLAADVVEVEWRDGRDEGEVGEGGGCGGVSWERGEESVRMGGLL